MLNRLNIHEPDTCVASIVPNAKENVIALEKFAQDAFQDQVFDYSNEVSVRYSKQFSDIDLHQDIVINITELIPLFEQSRL